MHRPGRTVQLAHPQVRRPGPHRPARTACYGREELTDGRRRPRGPVAPGRNKRRPCRNRGPRAGRRLALSSVKSMLSHQVESGAFFASTDFAPYRYCWLRDGSFTAFALDRAGEQEAAERFHRWAAAAVAGSPQRSAPPPNGDWPGGRTTPPRCRRRAYTVEGTVEREQLAQLPDRRLRDMAVGGLRARRTLGGEDAHRRAGREPGAGR